MLGIHEDRVRDGWCATHHDQKRVSDPLAVGSEDDAFGGQEALCLVSMKTESAMGGARRIMTKNEAPR